MIDNFTSGLEVKGSRETNVNYQSLVPGIFLNVFDTDMTLG